MTPPAAIPADSSANRLRFWLLLGLGVSLVILFAFALTVHTLASGFTSVESITKAAEKPIFGVTLALNVIVGLAFLLYIFQFGWQSLRVLVTVLVALVLGFLVIRLLTPEADKAYNSLLFGPISRTNRWGRWIDDAMALTLVGLAIAVVFRAKLFSLGAEGQIFLGGMAAGLVAIYVQGLPSFWHILLALIFAALVGFLVSLIPGLLRAYLGANELVSTLMLNPIALLLYEFILITIKPANKNFLVSPDFLPSALLPVIVPNTRVTIAIVIVMIAVIVVWLIIQRTPLGYEIRMVGSNPRFARYGGVNAKQTIVKAMGISGILAGLTGAYMALAIHKQLNSGLSSNLTFEGVVVALLARNNPLAIPAMALMYSYLRAGGEFMQNDARVSFEVVRIIQAIIILLFTAEGLTEFLRWRRRNLVYSK